MKAWQLTAANEPLRRIEREDPKPGPGQVVVDVRAAGICHSDVGFLDGTLTGMLSKLPMVLGHEIAGVVTELAPEVTGRRGRRPCRGSWAGAARSRFSSN